MDVFCRWGYLFIGIFFFGSFVGCYSFDVEDAFRGEFSSVKNNKIINDYCQGCHIHRDFDPGQHILAKRKLYRRELYRRASNCRVCHYVKPVWAREELIRKTRYPREVRRGKYRDFEKTEIKKAKK